MAETTYSDTLKKAVCSITTLLCDELLEICEEESKKRKRKVWVRNWMDKKKCGASETIIRELRDNDPLEFKSVIRLTPEQFEELLLKISPIISRADTFMRPALSARLKLELTLAFLASGTNSRILSVMFRVSKASISNMIPEVCDAIYSVLNDYIKVSIYLQKKTIYFYCNDIYNYFNLHNYYTFIIHST